MQVAEAWGKFPHEVEQLSIAEFEEIYAYLALKHQEEKKAMEKAKQEAKKPRPLPRRR